MKIGYVDAVYTVFCPVNSMGNRYEIVQFEAAVMARTLTERDAENGLLAREGKAA